MKKTALEIIQKFCKRANIPAPTTLVSVTDPATLQLIELLVATCEELRQAKCWPQQKRTHTFATVDSQSTYALPADFYAVSPFTEYDRANSLQIPSITDDVATHLLYKVQLASGTYSWRLFGFDENPASTGGQFQIIPTPSSVGNITFEYLSRNLFIPTNWAASTVFSAATYCNCNGNIYYTSAGGTTGATAPSHTTGSESDGAVTWTYTDTPIETPATDTDLCIFDYDLVKLGLRAKFYEENGGAYEQPKFEFESKITRAMTRMGPTISGDFGKRATLPRYTIPDGGWY